MELHMSFMRLLCHVSNSLLIVHGCCSKTDEWIALIQAHCCISLTINVSFSKRGCNITCVCVCVISQFSQVLCHFITRITFPPVSVTCFHFPLRASPKACLTVILIATFCSRWYMHALKAFNTVLFFSFLVFTRISFNIHFSANSSSRQSRLFLSSTSKLFSLYLLSNFKAISTCLGIYCNSTHLLVPKSVLPIYMEGRP